MTYILPLETQVKIEVIDFIFTNHQQFVGITIKPNFICRYIGHTLKVDETDVLKTLEQMKTDNQLIETGFYHPDKLYSVNPDML